MSNTQKTSTKVKQNIDKTGAFMLYLSYMRTTLFAVLIALSIYKPIALFQTLSLFQTFINIVCNYSIYYSVGAAVYIHNLFNL